MLQVIASTTGMDEVSSSEEVSVVTYQYPGVLWLDHNTETSLRVGWRSPTDDSVLRHLIRIAEVSILQNTNDQS